MFPAIGTVIVCMVMFMSFIQFIHVGGTSRVFRLSHFSLEVFYALVCTYCTVIIGFGLIYFLLSFEQPILLEHGQVASDDIIGSLTRSFYFSGVTLLTIGYGDITPMGIARMLAVTEAMIGYVLPAAFVLRLVQTKKGERDRQ